MRARFLAPLALCACSPHGSGPSGDLLALVADVPLPGGATRFDYQEIDRGKGQLVVAHMNDAAVLILALATGAVRKQLPHIPTPRGATGAGPDGDAWDPDDRSVGVSEQGDGALSLIADAGMGARTQVKLGVETGNVQYAATRMQFWITVVQASPPAQLVEVDPKTAAVTTTLPIPGCSGAHGLRLHPDGQSAFIACESNSQLARVDLSGATAPALAPTGADPDVLSIDPDRGW